MELIKYSALSKLLTGNEYTIRKGTVPKKWEKHVELAERFEEFLKNELRKV